jgi:hypothetical protein
MSSLSSFLEIGKCSKVQSASGESIGIVSIPGICLSSRQMPSWRWIGAQSLIYTFIIVRYVEQI